MVRFHDIIEKLFFRRTPRNIALVLGGGGARGYAHIGAVEVLMEHGFNITSVAGTSMGALVGGLFAAGKLDELKEKVITVNRRKILSLLDLSPGLDHIATADKLSGLLDAIAGGMNIEQLPIPFCCSATYIVSGREKVFRSGPLSQAIRASISIPGFFSPVRIDNEVLVDGSVHNTLPLNRVERHKGDRLVAVNVSAPGAEPMKGSVPSNFLKMAMRIAQISVQNNTQMAEQITRPDICVDIPMDTFGLMDFEKGREIIAYGRQAMEQALEEWDDKRKS